MVVLLAVWKAVTMVVVMDELMAGMKAALMVYLKAVEMVDQMVAYSADSMVV